MTRWLALDVGEARIGVALSDAAGFLASPYRTLYVSGNEAQTWATIQQLIRETEAEGLVVGLPISLDGQIHAQAERVQAFAERLKEYISIPLVFWDERLSTVEAARLLAERNQSRRNKGEGTGRRQRGGSKGRGQQRTYTKRRPKAKGHAIDALAATVILQEYLDQLGRQNKSKIEDIQL